MSEVEQKSNWFSKAGTTAIGIGIFVMLLEVISGSDSGLGAACCCFGIFGAVAGSIVSSAGAAVSSDGAMVLKQNSTGQWEWMPNSNIPEPVTNDPAANYNDQKTQIMSRFVTEIR